MRRKTSKEWFAIIDRWKVSGLNVMDFCKKEGISSSGFHKWKKKHREDNSNYSHQSKGVDPVDQKLNFIEIEPSHLQVSSKLRAQRILRITTSYGGLLEIPL